MKTTLPVRGSLPQDEAGRQLEPPVHALEDEAAGVVVERHDALAPVQVAAPLLHQAPRQLLQRRPVQGSVELDADRGDAGIVVVVALVQPAGVDGHGVGQVERADPRDGRQVDAGVAGGDDLGGGVDAPQPGLQGADVLLADEVDLVEDDPVGDRDLVDDLVPTPSPVARMALDAARGPGFDGVRITVAEDSRRTARRLLGDGAGRPTEPQPPGNSAVLPAVASHVRKRRQNGAR
jgi:hypothetical protein